MLTTLLVVAAAAGARAVPSPDVALHSLVWPPPRSMSVAGEKLPVAPEFSITTTHRGSATLDGAIARFSGLAAKTAATGDASSAGALRELKVTVASADESLGIETDYSYRLTIANGSATASAQTVFGAMYALESFTQLLDEQTGAVLHSSVSIDDAPEYQWRGLMIDSGRRFFPMDLVKNLMDTMAANKLNVLHLHASDMCRFGVESKLYPALHTKMTAPAEHYYSQDDIKAMIKYGKANGIRVVPEFDIPGHSRGFLPIECGDDEADDCIVFCTAKPDKSQIYGDPDGKTYGVLHKLFAEMAGLFDDDVFNIGADETSAKGPCSVNSSFSIERKIVDAIATDYKKTPEGWEELFFDAGAATEGTIVNAWARHSPSEITKTGRKAVESASDHFYFTSPGPAGPAGWSKCHYAIDTGVPGDEKKLLLGGEMSMWSDTYCDISQCGASSGSPPVGHELFYPKHDAEFGKSIGGMIWPRGYVGAASFWNFDNSTDVSSPAYEASIYKMNDMLAKRGSLVCPSKDDSGAPCACNQLTECGKPYLGPDGGL